MNGKISLQKFRALNVCDTLITYTKYKCSKVVSVVWYFELSIVQGFFYPISEFNTKYSGNLASPKPRIAKSITDDIHYQSYKTFKVSPAS